MMPAGVSVSAPLRLRALAHAGAALFLAAFLGVGATQATAGCPEPPWSIWKPVRDAKGGFMPMQYRLVERDGTRILEAKGSIKSGESGRLKAALAQHRPVHEVWLHSPGGTSVEGMRMGRLLRKQGMAVRVPRGAACFSACSMVLLGGALRAVDNGAYYGVHMWTAFGEAGADRFLAWLSGQLEKGVKGRDLLKAVSKRLQRIERDNADYARERANYLIEMSVSLRLMTPNVQTHASDRYWLCPNEMRSFNVTNY